MEQWESWNCSLISLYEGLGNITQRGEKHVSTVIEQHLKNQEKSFTIQPSQKLANSFYSEGGEKYSNLDLCIYSLGDLLTTEFNQWKKILGTRKRPMKGK